MSDKPPGHIDLDWLNRTAKAASKVAGLLSDGLQALDLIRRGSDGGGATLTADQCRGLDLIVVALARRSGAKRLD